MNIYTQYNARMSPQVVLESMDVYDSLKGNGGFYTKMFLGRNMEYLQKNVKGTISDLEDKAAKLQEEGSEEEAVKLKAEIAEWEKVLPRIEALTAE